MISRSHSPFHFFVAVLMTVAAIAVSGAWHTTGATQATNDGLIDLFNPSNGSSMPTPTGTNQDADDDGLLDLFDPDDNNSGIADDHDAPPSKTESGEITPDRWNSSTSAPVLVTSLPRTGSGLDQPTVCPYLIAMGLIVLATGWIDRNGVRGQS